MTEMTLEQSLQAPMSSFQFGLKAWCPTTDVAANLLLERFALAPKDLGRLLLGGSFWDTFLYTELGLGHIPEVDRPRIELIEQEGAGVSSGPLLRWEKKFHGHIGDAQGTPNV